MGIQCRKDKGRDGDKAVLGTIKQIRLYRLGGKWDTEAGSNHGGLWILSKEIWP